MIDDLAVGNAGFPLAEAIPVEQQLGRALVVHNHKMQLRPRHELQRLCIPHVLEFH